MEAKARIDCALSRTIERCVSVTIATSLEIDPVSAVVGSAR
jgi:hypothetical protein